MLWQVLWFLFTFAAAVSGYVTVAVAGLTYTVLVLEMFALLIQLLFYYETRLDESGEHPEDKGKDGGRGSSNANDTETADNATTDLPPAQEPPLGPVRARACMRVANTQECSLSACITLDMRVKVCATACVHLCDVLAAARVIRVAEFDYTKQRADELSFCEGDRIEVLDTLVIQNARMRSQVQPLGDWSV